MSKINSVQEHIDKKAKQVVRERIQKFSHAIVNVLVEDSDIWNAMKEFKFKNLQVGSDVLIPDGKADSIFNYTLVHERLEELLLPAEIKRQTDNLLSKLNTVLD